MTENDMKEIKWYTVWATIITLCLIFWFIILFFGCKAVCASEVDTTRAVIHHTASHDVSAAEIDRWHKERGWDGIGYHYVIRKDGTIEEGRSLSKRGAHARGRNGRVGIVLTGYDIFDARQIHSLKKLLARLGISDIEKHHQKCPGEGLQFPGLKDYNE